MASNRQNQGSKGSQSSLGTKDPVGKSGQGTQTRDEQGQFTGSRPTTGLTSGSQGGTRPSGSGSSGGSNR